MIIRIDPQLPILCFHVWAYLKKDLNFDSLLQLVPNAFQHVSLSQLANTVFIRSPSIAESDRESASDSLQNFVEPKLHHDTTIRSWSYSDEVGTDKNLSFSRFLRFLTELIKEDFTSHGADSHNNIPGLPPQWVQKLIPDLIEAIKHLHFQGFSGRLFHLPKLYVWCKGRELKLFGVDEKKEYFNPEAWLCRLEVDIFRFGVILKDLILVGTPSVALPQRDVFLKRL